MPWEVGSSESMRIDANRCDSTRARRGVAPCAGSRALPSSAPEMKKSDPGVAAVLSLIVPGVGQIYNGAFLRGIFWLIITPGFWIGSGGTLGWVCHILASLTAYRYAKRA